MKLKSTLTKEIDSITKTLDGTKKRVAGVRSWWKGGSEEGFINNFEKTKKEVEKGLRQWLEDYQRLIDKVEQTKREQDDALKRALNA
jgi:uncharacterized protein YukE